MPLAVEIRHGEQDVRCCRRKKKYGSLDAAQEALIRVVERFRDGLHRDPAPHRPMNVYRCGACGFFHIGHRPQVVPT